VKDTCIRVKETCIRVKETYIHVQRDLHLCKRDVYSRERHLYSCKRDLHSCERDLHSCTKRPTHETYNRDHCNKKQTNTRGPMSLKRDLSHSAQTYTGDLHQRPLQTLRNTKKPTKETCKRDLFARKVTKETCYTILAHATIQPVK